MPRDKINIESFLDQSETALMLDVRSPIEYDHAHIPGAVNLPLFSDEERKAVGTLYKQKSREDAIKAGLDFFGAKMRSMVEAVESLLETHPAGKQTPILMHCARGGMRSAAVAWLLDLYGFRVSTLAGGYKTFRRFVLELFIRPHSMQLIGGYSGSGKTDILHELKDAGKSVIDLEALANHRGSALGGIGRGKQPSQEMFENRLGLELHRLRHAETIFVEDESQRIGDRQIPMSFWDRMRSSQLFFLDVPFEDRLQYIIKNYGDLPPAAVKDSITRISKRLGGLDAKNAKHSVDEGDIKGAFEILLRYYDKQYRKALPNRSSLAQVTNVPALKVCEKENSAALLNKLFAS